MPGIRKLVSQGAPLELSMYLTLYVSWGSQESLVMMCALEVTCERPPILTFKRSQSAETAFLYSKACMSGSVEASTVTTLHKGK